MMPAELLPVDAQVSVPPAVARATAMAAELHARAYGKTEPVVPAHNPNVIVDNTSDKLVNIADAPPIRQAEEPAQVQPVVQPQVQPAVQPAEIRSQPDPQPQQISPQPDPQPQQISPQPDNQPVPAAEWENRYNSMKGRFDKQGNEIARMQRQMSELGDELLQSQRVIAELRHVRSAPPVVPQRKLVTEQDVKEYGPEMLNAVQRAAIDAVAPLLTRVDQQVQKTNQELANNKVASVYDQLASQVPNWDEINNNPRFKIWCGLRDVYSGAVRGSLLQDALRQGNSSRVIAFFNGFLAEERATGHLPSPQSEPVTQPRIAAVSLESLAAPGRAHPAAGADMPTTTDKPIYTCAQISRFYDRVRKGQYVGREGDKARDEAAIFAAQREGRVRG
jgi:hypothetical protein